MVTQGEVVAYFEMLWEGFDSPEEMWWLTCEDLRASFRWWLARSWELESRVE